MNFGPVSLMAAIGAFLFILLAVISLNLDTSNRLRTRLFSGFLAAISLTLINLVIVDSQLALLEPRLVYIGNTLGLAAAPLLCLFARALAFSDTRLTPASLVHFLPLMIIILVVIWQYHSQSRDLQLAILTGGPAQSWLSSPFFVLGIFCYPIVYLLLTARVAWRYEQASRATRSASDGQELRWLVVSVAGMMAGATLSVLHYLVTNIYPVRWVAILLILLLGIGVLALGAFFVLSAFRSLHYVNAVTASRSGSEKYGEHRLSEDQVGEFASIVRQFMKEQRPHLNAALTLDQLAHRLPMTSRELSQAINRGCGQSFYEFVAAWRVQDAMAQMKAAPEKTITSIMLESGFSSKSSFASAFRRETGQTPTSWRRTNSGSNTRPRTT